MTQPLATRRPLVVRMGIDIGFGHTKLAMDSGLGAGTAASPTAPHGTRSKRADVTVFPSTVTLSRGALAHGGVIREARI